MVDLFKYLEYRDYLHDFYSAKKEENPSFSFRLFSDLCGFKSKSYIQHVIDGKKNLSTESLEKLNKVLKLSDRPFSYLSELVRFDQSKSAAEKSSAFEKICAFKDNSGSILLVYKQYEYFSNWYHQSMREIIVMRDWKDDFALIGSHFKPALSERQVRKSIQLLIDLDLVKKVASNYIQTNKFVTTGAEVRSLSIRNFHLQNLNLAGDSIDNWQSNERDISALTIALSEKGFETFKEELITFRKKLMTIADKDNKPNRVYDLSMVLFPTTHPVLKVASHE